ncbi:hypothetical protein AB6806_10935 [Bosea sp. RCC_152_1]|uniref:hypothetical protein n=1 Tax=Bosea sp. RCC_152_1 TaxID=3239228 RepID=UPI0035263977
MKKLILSAAIAASAGACATVPELPSEDKISAARVVDRVQCELHDVVKNRASKYPWLKKWVAGFTLTLRVDETASITPSVASLVGLAGGPGGDLFGAGASGSFSGTTKRLAQMTFRVALKDAADYRCPRSPTSGLEGQLGIGEWLDRSLGSMDDHDLSKKPKTIGYTIEFAVVKGGKASADITLLPVKSPGSFGFGLAVAGQRSDTHTLDVAFADGSAAPPQEVIVVKLPGPPPEKGIESLRPHAAPQSFTIRIPDRSAPGPDAIDRQLDQLQFRNELRR